MTDGIPIDCAQGFEHNIHGMSKIITPHTAMAMQVFTSVLAGVHAEPLCYIICQVISSLSLPIIYLMAMFEFLGLMLTSHFHILTDFSATYPIGN